MVLIVEDEKMSRKALAALLTASGYQARAVGSAEEALDVLDREHEPPDVALVDLDLPGMSGEEFVKRLMGKAPSVAAFIVTAAERERVADLTPQPATHLRKPIDYAQLLSLLPQDGAAAAARHHHPHDRAPYRHHPLQA